jgi:hypothetical protein
MIHVREIDQVVLRCADLVRQVLTKPIVADALLRAIKDSPAGP